MKRFAAVAVLSASIMCAQAQSAVTIYGLIDAAASYGDGGTPGSKIKRLDSGVGPGTRLGFRGSEDLGSGLRAIFDLQMGFDSGTGTFQQGGLAFGRFSYVGLRGPNWTLTAGRQFSPNENAMIVSDVYGQAYWGSTSGYGIGSLQNPGGGSVAGSGCQGATVRINNSVQGTYTAGPVTGALMISAGDENPTGSGRLINSSVTYNSGPAMLTVGYARMRQCSTDIPANARPDWQTEFVAGGSFDFGAAKLFAGYYNWNPSELNKVLTPTTYVNHKVTWVGVRVPVGVAFISGQLARLSETFVGQEEARGTSLGVTYEYFLSKRTRVYVSGGYVKNNDRARFGMLAATSAQAAGGVGANPRVLSVGTAHSF